MTSCNVPFKAPSASRLERFYESGKLDYDNGSCSHDENASARVVHDFLLATPRTLLPRPGLWWAAEGGMMGCPIIIATQD